MKIPRFFSRAHVLCLDESGLDYYELVGELVGKLVSEMVGKLVGELVVELVGELGELKTAFKIQICGLKHEKYTQKTKF